MSFTPLSQILLFIFPICMVVSGIILVAGYWRTRAGGRHCSECDYNLVATPSGHEKCPECGNDLASGVVETSITPTSISRRRVLRRMGFASLAVSLGIGATSVAISGFRVPYTPNLILLHFDLPLAFSAPGTILSQKVFDELEIRYDAGQLSPNELRLVADRLIKEMDEPNHVRWAGSDLLFRMWMDGRISNAELKRIKRIWPVPEIALGDMQYPNAVDVKILAPCWIQSKVSAYDPSRSLQMEMAVNRLRFGEEPRITTSAHRVVQWLDVPLSMTMSQVSPSEELEAGPTRLQCEVIFRLRDVRGWAKDDVESAPLIGEKRHDIDIMVQLKDPPPHPRRNREESACNNLKAELEANSWIELTPQGTGKIMLGLAEPPIGRIGTADLAGPLTDSWSTDRPNILFVDGRVPEEKRHWSSIRLPFRHQLNNAYVSSLRFQPIWMHEIGFDRSPPEIGDEVVLQFDSRNFDHGSWLAWHMESSSKIEMPVPPEEILDCRFELRLRVIDFAEKPSTNP